MLQDRLERKTSVMETHRRAASVRSESLPRGSLASIQRFSFALFREIELVDAPTLLSCNRKHLNHLVQHNGKDLLCPNGCPF